MVSADMAAVVVGLPAPHPMAANVTPRMSSVAEASSDTRIPLELVSP
jgi:hypothetical protein